MRTAVAVDRTAECQSEARLDRELARVEGALEALAIFAGQGEDGTFYSFTIRPSAHPAHFVRWLDRLGFSVNLVLWLCGKPGAGDAEVGLACLQQLRRPTNHPMALARLHTAEQLSDLVLRHLDPLLGPDWVAQEVALPVDRPYAESGRWWARSPACC